MAAVRRRGRGRKKPRKRVGRPLRGRKKKAAPKKATKKAARRATPAASGARAPVLVDIVTFNTHGAMDSSGNVEKNVGQFLREQRPTFVCFQELFFAAARKRMDQELLGRTRTVVSATKDIERVRSTTGSYRQRVATIRRQLVSPATAGLAIYTSMPFTKPKFFDFDHSQVPDLFALKGVLTIQVTFSGFTFILGVTHFHDSDNDRVDGRARKANIKTVARSLESAAGMPVVLVGDFNIDARTDTGLDPGLLGKLKKVRNRSWLEAGAENATQNGFARPVPTTSTGNKCIDFVLASGAGQVKPSLARGTYRARDDFTSDHRLVRSTLVFS